MTDDKKKKIKNDDLETVASGVQLKDGEITVIPRDGIKGFEFKCSYCGKLFDVEKYSSGLGTNTCPRCKSKLSHWTGNVWVSQDTINRAMMDY